MQLHRKAWIVVMLAAMGVNAQNLREVRVGLRTQSSQHIVRVHDIDYVLVFQGASVDTLHTDAVTITPAGTQLDVKTIDGGRPADSIHVMASGMFTAQIGRYLARQYLGRMVCRVYRRKVQSILVTPRTEYLMGVIHAELGYLEHPELWKAQAVVANTWFQRNHGKFKSQGFQVTDDVRSQVYHGLPSDSTRLADLKAAVSEVESHIIVDSIHPSDGPIEALFHANSGGQTMDCGWYFGPRPYLVSFADEFSLDCKQTSWTKRLTAGQWTDYLARQLGQSSSDSVFVHWATHLPLGSRAEHLVYDGHKVRLRQVREYYQLRSTWFATRLDGDWVVLEGRGYGHGIGMSQEGAHRMAMLGFTFEEILEFYYPHTLIVPLD